MTNEELQALVGGGLGTLNKADLLQTRKQEKINTLYNSNPQDATEKALLDLQRESAAKAAKINWKSPNASQELDTITSGGKAQKLLSGYAGNETGNNKKLEGYGNLNTAPILQPAEAEEETQRGNPLLSRYTNINTAPINPESISGENTSILDTFGASSARVASKVERAGGDILTSISKAQADYDAKHPSKDPNAIGANWGKSFSDGLRKAGDALKNDATYNEILAEQYYNPSHAGSKMAGDVWQDLKKGNVIDAADKVTGAGTLDLIAESLPEMSMYFHPATFSALYAGNVSEARKEYQEQNPGQDVSNARLGAMMIGEAVSMGLEKFAIGKMIGPTEIAAKGNEVLSSLAGKVAPAVLVEASKYVGKKAGSIAEAALAEGAQEVVQEGQRVLTTQYDTGKDIMTEENLDRLGTAFVGGGIAGGGIRTGVELPSIAGGVMRGADTALTMASEAATGRTADEVRAKQAETNIMMQNAVKEIDSRRIPITEGMTPEQRDNADMVNRSLDDMYSIDFASNKSAEELTTNLNAIDNMKADMGFTSPTMPEVSSEPMVEETTAQAKVEYADKDTENTAERTGLMGVLTKSDKVKEIRVEHTDGTRVADASKKKSKLVSAFDIDDDVISDIMAGNMNEDVAASLTNTKGNSVVNFAKRIAKKLSPSNVDVFKSLQDLGANVTKAVSENDNAKTAMDALFGEKASPEKAMRAVALVIDTVHSAMRSEYDINKKYNINNDKVAGARRQDVAHQLGKELVNSYELRLAGKPTEMAKAYIEIGEHMLAIAEAAGAIESDTGNVALHNMVDAKGDRLSDAKAKEYYPSVQKGTVQVPTVRVTGVKSTTRGAGTDTVSAANALAKLLKPINYELPTQEPVETVPVQSAISDKHEEIIKEYNKMKYSIKPEALQLLKDVKEYINTAYDGNVDKALSKDQMLINLLGLKKTDAGIRKNTEAGKSIGRKGTMINLLDNLEYLEEGDLNFNFESAINQRIHVMQTILDFQGDKYMARQILQGGNKAKKVDGRARRLLINTVADDLGVEPSEVENPTNKAMISAMGRLDEVGTIPMGELSDIARALKVKSPFKALSLIKAMSDIRKSKGGAVTTSYQVENDATASGVMNTLLNLSGHPKVQAILELLGVGQDTKGTDPYNFIASVLSKHALYESSIKPILDELKAVGMDARNVAKYPIMKWFYGQLDKNNQEDMGRDIAEDLVDKALYEYNQDAMDLINRVLGEQKYAIDVDGTTSKTAIYNITEADMKKVADYYAEKLASYYVKALGTTFAEVKGYREKMGKIYTMLKKTGKWNGQIRTAMDALLKSDRPYKMSVQKLKQMVFTEDNTTYTTNELMDNETSFNVNLQHATDAALLLMSIRDILGDVVDSGVMTVHDALYADPETSLKIMERYNHYTKEAALNYDYMDAALQELNDAIQKMDKADPLRKQYEQEYEGMKAENDKLIKSKETYLEDKELNILGDWEIGNELAKERKDNAPEVKATTVKVRNEKAKATVQSTLSAMTMLAKDGLKGIDVEAFLDLIKNLPDLRTESKELIEKIANALGRGVEVKTGKKWEGGSNIVVIPSEVSLTIRGKKSGDTITLDSNALVEVLAHEIDHAVQLQYIKANMNSNEIKYLQRVLQSITSKADKLSPVAKARLGYINSQKEDYLKMAELSAILSNEIDVRNDMLAQMSSTAMEKVIEIIKKIAKDVKDFFKTVDPETLDINVENTMMALQELNDNAILNTAKANNTSKEVTGITDQKDVEKESYLNPYTAVNEGIAKTNRFASDWLVIWGSVMEDAIGAPLAKKHMKLKREHAMYRSAMNLLRSGFYDSDFAQRMHYILGVANDVKDTVIKSALSLATAYQQETQKELEAMAEMDRQIKEKYNKEERVVIHRLFANTGVANIIMMPEVKDALVSGTKTVEELIEEVGAKLDPEKRKKLDEVAKYWVTGETNTNAVNVRHADDISKEAYVYATLKAMSQVKGGEKLFTAMDDRLRNWMMSMALINKKLNDEINEKGRDYKGIVYSMDSQYHGMYDGSYSMDIHDTVYEYKAVTKAEMRRTMNSSENEWVVVREPASDGSLGLIARENLGAGYVTGVGLELNRYANGIYLSEEQSQVINEKLSKMVEEDRKEYLANHSMVQDGRRFRMLIDYQTKVEKLSLVQNAAHSLYRTYIHNKELIQSEAVRRIMQEEGTRTITTKNGMMELERVLRENDKKGIRGKMGERVEVEPFVSIDYSANDLKDIESFDMLRKQYPMIAKYYKTPEGLSNFNDFNRKVSLVKRGVSDVLLGHKNFSVFGDSDNRTAAKMELLFKKMVVLAKQKMIVTNPVKLVQDSITNAGILSMMDIGVVEIYEGYKEGFQAYKEFSTARSKLVDLTMKARMADAMETMEPSDKNKKAKVYTLKQLKDHEDVMKGMAFYDAFNAGFVQSYSTDLVTKEFDTISGIQKDIDNVIDKYTHDKNGNPNKLFDAIKWWQSTGMGMDEVFAAIGKSARMKDTDTGTEMIQLAERLKNKKADKESVSRYISDIIGAPASEVVAYGSAYMVLADALSKYVLAKHLMEQENPRSGERGKRRKYTKEEAYSRANDTFIDYRTNMPHEIKALSDYGILMFPAYWMKVQKVIAGLVKYHPVSALGSYAMESAMGAGGMNVLDQNVISKAGGYYGIIHSPTEIIGPEALFAIL